MVRQAIDAYDPDKKAAGLEASDLLELVHAKVKEAIASTKKANRALSAGLKKLSKAEDWNTGILE